MPRAANIPAGPAKPSRKKILLWSSCGLAAAILLIGVCRWFTFEPEPQLSPEERIARDFQKAFDPEESTLSRLRSLRRSFKTARGIPQSRRHEVIVESLAESVVRTIEDFSKLPPEAKAARAKLLEEDAERTRKYFRKFPKAKQRQAVALLSRTPGGRAQFNRAVDTVSGLSPADRQLLGPTVKIWKSMLEDGR
ncbi:MAG: hypothetical protein IJS14_12650 [Lentisphaeria bacterium]|nr:hypothetical protein [Lentisphaeria bacterium]